MDTLYRILLAGHGLSGLVALVTFWICLLYTSRCV